MGLVDEFKSGQNAIYAQWAALINFPILLGCGISSFGVGIIGTRWIWAILSCIFAAITLLLELPLITRCCPTRGSLGVFVSFCENIMVRAAGYLIFAIILFAGSVHTAFLMVAPGIFFLIVSGFYAFALVKGQDLKRSVITGGQGL